MQESTWGDVYRNHEMVARRRIAELIERLDAEGYRAVTSKEATVLAKREARAIAGVVGVVGGAATLVAAALSLAVGDESYLAFNAVLLLTALAATGATYVLARVGARNGLRRRAHARLRTTADVPRDLQRLERANPAQEIRRQAHAVGERSIAWPLMAVALLGPLTLHFVVAALTFAANGDLLEDFGAWMAWSALLVGHAHLVLAVMSFRHAKKLMSGAPIRRPFREFLRAAGWTTAAAAVPGILLFGLPPLIVAATGLCVTLPAFVWARRTADNEHRALCGARSATRPQTWPDAPRLHTMAA